MRVPAYKQLRWLSVYFTLYSRVIFSRVASNMGHPYVYIFTGKPRMFRKCLPQLFAVDIAIHAFQRFKGSKAVGQLNVAKIACMPYLVTCFKMFKNCIVEEAVGVGKQAYAGQMI